MAVQPLPPGLEQAIARMQLTRERIAAKRRPFAPGRAPVLVIASTPSPRPAKWPGPGPERLNRPVQVGRVIRVWWNWD